MEINGIYSFAERNNNLSCFDCQKFENDEYQIVLATDAAEDLTDEFIKVYKEHGQAGASLIPALFLAVVFNKKNGFLQIFSDITSSMLNMYYTVNNGMLYYSTSLKWLLANSNIERKMNMDAAAKFLVNGFLFDEDTLLENVFKLKGSSVITVNGDNLSQDFINYNFKKVKKSFAKKELIPTMQNNILSCFEKTGDATFIPLSNGYDSNFVLHTLINSSDKPVKAFTVGGKSGKNEVYSVQENVKNIENVELTSILIDNNYLNNLTDIVWRLEGAVFESGIFLQYALANTLKSNGAKYLICGEYADQILSSDYIKSYNRYTKEKVSSFTKLSLHIDPYVLGNLVILKKSGIMLNSFGIKGRYPFARQNIIPLSFSLRHLNGITKDFYKKCLKNVFQKNIAENVKKQGGSTDNLTVISTEDYKKWKILLDNNHIINSIIAQSKNQSRSYFNNNKFVVAFKKTLFYIRKDGFFKYTKRVLTKFSNSSNTNNINDELDKVLIKIYLLSFYELFVDGKYDFLSFSDAPITTQQLFDLYK